MGVTFYQILDRSGTLVAIHQRKDNPDGAKDVLWRRPDGTAGLNGTPVESLPLYGIHRLDGWPEGESVVVTEGEKAADALTAIGIPAVGTVTGAATAPSADVLADLAGRSVIVWPDNDKPGREHMERVAERLDELAVVGWLDWPDAPDKGDAADYLTDGRTADDVRTLLATAHAAPSATPQPSAAPVEVPWPAPLAAEAMHGLAGRFVASVAPWSEADPAAILFGALSMFGALVGPSVHAMAGDAEHPARLNVLVVGPTGKGRKDTAARPSRRLVDLADADFAARIVDGLSSGEGVIYAVRDPVEKVVQVGKGADKHLEQQVVDEGVDDKRLLVRESEFASVLRVSQRDGNILSAVVRKAWESGELRTLTRNNPVTATGAHVVVAGNITRDELLRYLDRTEIASGFMNRFLVCAARRAQVLPDGEGVPAELLAPLGAELRTVVAWARESRLLRRDDGARAIWHAVYERLSDGAPGMYGAATNRAEAQVLRLSVLYAILDRSPVITGEHLMAALAVWQYAADSARWVFGDAIGDPTADAILAALRTRGGMDRTDIRDLFGRHVERSRIEQALVALESYGRIRRGKDTATGGRPRETWHVV